VALALSFNFFVETADSPRPANSAAYQFIEHFLEFISFSLERGLALALQRDWRALRRPARE
jgi:hypothetical protein